ncbi:Multidrug resistance protein MdtG [Fundidesulfovibrio magnetotacticus]|uniref:Multidrug resistance protein MdtG n=1 Tax=Fundidesulfovibrio magnetotacticus TaxID=2730080 RepID=A0A6V8LVX7_9BACT|nr:MFS transporter [Fundidesulfovibrio magnetotacticus]GFK95894.1 Multidrug resistance protein MdtG [Fundidesulfovibrio magnetotacticus]
MTATPFRLLCAAGFLAILSTTMAKNPALPLFAASLGAGPEGVGLVSALSPLAGVLAGIPGGLCADAFGRRRMLLGSSVVFATAPLAYLLVDSVAGLALARFYHGLATGVFMPVAQAAVADACAVTRGERLGAFSSATLAGRFLAPTLGGLALGGGFAAVYGLCALAGIGAMLLTFRLPPLEERSAAACRPRALDGLRELLASPGIRAGCLLEAGILFAYGAFEAFLPLLCLERGLPAWMTGLVFSAQILAVALTKPFFGRLSDRLSRDGAGRPAQMLAGAALTALSCAALPLAPGLWGLSALSVALGLSLSVATSASTAYVADLARREHRGAAMGVLGSVMDVGHSAGPLAAGAAAALAGSAGAFAAGAAVLAAATLAAWRIRRRALPGGSP